MLISFLLITIVSFPYNCLRCAFIALKKFILFFFFFFFHPFNFSYTCYSSWIYSNTTSP